MIPSSIFRGEKNIYLPVFFLSFFPSFMLVTFNVGSMTIGLVLSMLIIHVLYIFSFRVRLTRLHFLLSFVVLFSIINSVVQNYEVLSYKAMLNWFLFFYFLLFTLLLSKFLVKFKDKELNIQIRNISYYFIIIAFFSILINFNYPFPGYTNLHKAIFPFAEPSHFALTAAYFLIPAGVLYNQKQRVLILCCTLFLAFCLPSSVMLVVSLIMLYLFFVGTGVLRICIILFFTTIGFFLFYSLKDANPDTLIYFTSRMTYDEDTTNVSLLVFLMGWQDAINSLIATNGLGLGIFQMGIAFKTGEFGERIYDLVGSYKNLKDGGSLGAKSISEFGVLGILMILLYLKQCFVSSEFILNHKNDKNIPSILILSHCWIVVFIIEIFVRATHYFSIGFILMLSALSIIKIFKGRLDGKL
ncbi:hypothetical protein [Colwellia sp. Bg11-28]|uniref:hypothetical protein n=1 Tax=Colwellia sp. Bg11-28 TaxID=2058305 RepID=UPI000C347153|nr:hypothetical protein [Colwellia sp. Bg11-28]PKH87994.1 hypothetical protein CXF79_15410 [Colwellia sp. Bg11-28]